METVTIHANVGIEWQRQRARHFMDGLMALGITPTLTNSHERISEAPAILLGTTLWTGVERAEGDWLLVDRASWGDPYYVQLVWNGHGRRGDHCIPEQIDGKRFEKQSLSHVPMMLSFGGRPKNWHVVLCGQHKPYSPTYRIPFDWYDSVKGRIWVDTFRPHPNERGLDPLPRLVTWDRVAQAVTLNSSVAFEAIFKGIETVVEDEGGLGFTGSIISTDEQRIALLREVSYTHWNTEEIQSGKAITHLFDKVGA